MRKVFLGGLPKSVTDDRLKEMFSKYGAMTDHVVMKDSRTRASRGFGFIEFDNEESVDALLNDRPIIVDGREIEIRRAMPKNVGHTTIHEKTRRLFIGGLSHSVTEEDIRKYYEENFSKYGKVESVEIKRDKVSNVSRGFGFVTFDSEDAVDAIILKETRPIGFGRNCEVKKSEPKVPESGRRNFTRKPSPDDRRRSRMSERDRRGDSRDRERMPMFRDYDYGRSPPRERYYPSYDYGDSYEYERQYSNPPSSYQHSYSTQRTSRGIPPRDSGIDNNYGSSRAGENSYGSRSGYASQRNGEESSYRQGYFRNPY